MVRSLVHVVAIVKGTVEGDPIKHFGSLMGWPYHLAEAVRLGLVESEPDGSLVITARGWRFYAEADLANLPEGRANHWGSAVDRAVAMLSDYEEV